MDPAVVQVPGIYILFHIKISILFHMTNTFYTSGMSAGI
jgi:hypothetical protein